MSSFSTEAVELRPFLRTLIPVSSPVEVPPPAGMAEPPASSESSDHQRALPRHRPTACHFVPALSSLLLDRLDSFLVDRLQKVNSDSPVPVALELAPEDQYHVQKHLRDFSRPLFNYNEPSATQSLMHMLTGVRVVVESVDKQLKVGENRTVGTASKQQIPKRDTASLDPRYQACDDIFMGFQLPGDSLVYPVAAIEMKSSDASQQGGGRQVGLFWRFRAEIARLGSFTLDDLHGDLRSLLEKAVVQAVVRRLPFFYFSDTYTFMVLVFIYDSTQGSFEVLLSDLHYVAPSAADEERFSLLTLLLLPFYSAHLSLPSLHTTSPAPPAARLATIPETRHQQSGPRPRTRAREDNEVAGPAGGTRSGKKARGGEMQEVETAMHSLTLENYSAVEWTLIYPDETALQCKPVAPPSPAPSSSSSAIPPHEPSGSTPSPPSSVLLTPPALATSLPPADTSPALSPPPHLRLSHLIGIGANSRAWLGFLDTNEEHPYVVKVSRSGREEKLRQEAGILLSHRTAALSDCIVPALGLFDAGRHAVLLMEYGGEVPETWEDWSMEQRRVLFIALLRLHRNSITHGDLQPCNTVGLGDGKFSPRWLDMSNGTLGRHACPGAECEELEEALEIMNLHGERSKLAEMAAAAGLVWQ
ncbi:hypothetical protein JCM10213_004193 [Rhodosporidiobolus nylandii]